MDGQALPRPIQKKLDQEQDCSADILYFPMAGASQMDNYRSPDAFVFLFFEQGSGTHSIDFTSHATAGGQVHISYPGQLHSWNSGADTFGHKLIISKRFVERYLLETVFGRSPVNLMPILTLSSDTADSLREDICKFAVDYSRYRPDALIVVVRALTVIVSIHQLQEELQEQQRRLQGGNSILLRFFELIDRHILTEKSVLFYASKLHISTNYLGVLCREHTGLSPKELIDRRLILEVKRLLLGSEYSIKEITYLLGFRSQSSFSRYLKRMIGVNPRSFRKEC